MKNKKGLFIKDPNFWRVPRKLKKQIPKNTPYCYTPITKPGIMSNGVWGFKIKQCPFSTYIKIKNMKPIPDYIDFKLLENYGEDQVNWCKLVKCEIEDQCKNCGIKKGY